MWDAPANRRRPTRPPAPAATIHPPDTANGPPPDAAAADPPWRPRLIADHGFLSNGRGAALVHRDGTIDWLCLPRFDSEPCFAALLGDGRNGAWWMAPDTDVVGRARRYVGATLVLETLFETAAGSVTVTDFMPTQADGDAGGPTIMRVVEGRRGRVPMRTRLALRFDSGRVHPLIRARHDDAAGGAREAVAIAGADGVALWFDAPIEHRDRGFECRFSVAAGERRCFAMTWFSSHADAPGAPDPDACLEATRTHWTTWAARSRLGEAVDPLVARSLLVLKGLIHTPTGGIVAAATASLPETPDGGRNWDYRFCWLRDATFTLLAFLHAGHADEARAWIAWLRRAIAGDPIDVRPFYTVEGARHLPEWEADWLPGFGGARPVRFGNGAVGQCQLDIYGEVLDAVFIAERNGLSDDGDVVIRLLATRLESLWRGPDAGIWESRGQPRQHTYSKAMCWVAFDRASRWTETRDPEASRRWRRLADEARREVLARGFDPDRGAFTRAFDDPALDGATLRLPLVGFIDANDPRMIGTVAAIERDLLRDGYVWRYSSDLTDDGVGGQEGAFLAVGCWLADVYAMQGRAEDARAMFRRTRDAANDLGLLSEEVWPQDGRALGNIPQALSHVALVNTALTLANGGRPPRLRAS